MHPVLTLSEVEAIIRPVDRRGATSRPLARIAALEAAEPGDLSFLANLKHKARVASTRASVVLVPPGYEDEPGEDQLLLVVAQPSASLTRICARIEQSLWPRPAAGVHASAVVAPEARVDPTATIGPLCVVEAGAEVGPRVHLQAQVFIGRDARVGADCRLMAGAVLASRCSLHERVVLHAGVVVGADGFGYEFEEGRHAKVPQIGVVEIEADVEIGANSTLDRARFSRTLVGEGTKIDNLVQVAHNVVIGKHCLLCAQVGIAGSTTLGDYVVLGGQAGVAGHLRVAKGTKVGGGAAVSSHTEPGAYLNGSPAIPYMLERRIAVLQQRLPDLFRRFASLESEVENLKKSSAW
jgi:UDP-3-O-[3-hydroxymyristoyl] glucosamine N-acyltransferase